MVKAICPICKESYNLGKLLFLPCGHGFCTTCTIRDNSNHHTCAICRQNKGHEPPRPIYVTLESGSTTQDDSEVARVLDTLDRVDVNSASASVLDITRNIRRVVNETPMDKEIARFLLDAAINIEEKTIPLYDQIERQEKRLDALQTSTQMMSRDVSNLSAELTDTKHTVERAFEIAEQSKDIVLEERKEKNRLKRKVEALEGKLEAERNTSAAKILERDKQIKLLKTKAVALGKLTKHRRQDEDASLVIEG